MNPPTSTGLRRILFVNPVGGLGGAERSLVDLLASLRAADPPLELHLLLFAPGPLEEEARRLGVMVEVLALPERLHSLGDSGLLKDRRWRRELRLLVSLARASPSLLTFRHRLASRIRMLRPDIVHTNGVKAHLLTAAAGTGKAPLVWHIHDFLSERPLAQVLARWLHRRAAAAVAISDAVLRDVESVLPGLDVTTILNAIDVDQFSPAPVDARALDALSGLSPAPIGAIRLGLVATYARWKGQDAFLQAAARVRAAAPSRFLRFYVVGGPIYATDASQFSTEDLGAMIRSLGLAHVAGLIPFQRDLPWVFRSLDIVVHSSTRPEPFGRSIIEAMSCGRAVIVAAAGGARELVEEEVTGLTHPAGDVQALAACMLRLTESAELRAGLGARARSATVPRFSRERLGPAVLSLYNRLAASAETGRTRRTTPLGGT